jgi:broad specificity phosphatase PhoE
MATFFLIRHANNDFVGRTITGWTPGVHLNTEGREQAARLARKLTGRGITRLYSSPLERAVETAEPIAQELTITLEICDSFTEVQAGDWTGKTYAQLEHDRRWPQFNDYRSVTRIPGGELMLETQTRFVTELLCLRERYGDETMAVVSHADPIRAALLYFLGMPLDFCHRVEISPAAFSIVRIEQWGPQVLVMNEGAA